jgi:hypothetical protein
VLAAGSLTGGLSEYQHRQELARVAAQQRVERIAEQQRAATDQSGAGADQDLLATVDSDIAREVPAAMEPLAQLMDDTGTK